MNWDRTYAPYYFSQKEFLCPHCGRENMDAEFIAKLDKLRAKFGKPLIVSSGWRCPEHNNAVSETGSNGPHTTGLAVDFLIAGEDAYRLLACALSMGFQGIGVKQSGIMGARFLHLDMLVSELRPRVWSY